MHPENVNYIQNFSGSDSNITNNINIKNVNIINCNDSNSFNDENNNQNLFLLDKFNVNNTILQNNKLNNKKNNYFRHNNFINFSNINENNNYKDKFHDLNQKSNNLEISFPQNVNKVNSPINSLLDLKQISFENDKILEQTDFVNFLKNLKTPLTKLLTTKKGICEIENYILIKIRM